LKVSEKLHVIDDFPSGQETPNTLFIGGYVGPKPSLDAAPKSDNVFVSEYNIHGLSAICEKVAHNITLEQARI